MFDGVLETPQTKNKKLNGKVVTLVLYKKLLETIDKDR